MSAQVGKGMQGRRIYCDGAGLFYADKNFTAGVGNLQETLPGDYWFSEGFGWAGKVPTGARCGLRNHQVTEHEDGTITVSPSILLTCPGMDELNWHGFLERGVWREC